MDAVVKQHGFMGVAVFIFKSGGRSNMTQA